MTTSPQAHSKTKLSVRMRDTERYAGAPLLDFLLRHFNLTCDAHLARELELESPILCKIRTGKLLPSAAVLIRIHEASGLTIAEMRAVMEKPASRARAATGHAPACGAHLL